MTKFSQIELLYNQFLNLSNEIEAMIENEEYDSASEKIELKNNLIKQLANAKKTTTLSNDEAQKMQNIEDTIKQKNDIMLANLEALKKELEGEVKTNKQKIKLNSAYDQLPEAEQGNMIDILE